MADKLDIHIAGIEGGSARFIAGFVNLEASGFQSTIDAYMRCLLTRKGTNPFDPAYGTAYADLPGSNMGGREDLLRSIIAEAVQDAQDTILRYQRVQSMSTKARLLSAVINSYQKLGTDSVELTILLKNQAGEKILAVLPQVVL